MKTLWVGLGGAIGSIARYHVGAFATKHWPGFPWGTLAVNVVGSFLMSIVVQLVARDRLTDEVRVLLAVGVLGGFTTYSSFNVETIALANQGAWGRAALYVGITLVGCMVAGVLGWVVARP